MANKKRDNYAQRLAARLSESNIGEVEHGDMGDKSCYWVCLQSGNIKLEINFDPKGERITNIGIFQDIIEKTGERQLFAFGKTNHQTQQP